MAEKQEDPMEVYHRLMRPEPITFPKVLMLIGSLKDWRRARLEGGWSVDLLDEAIEVLQEYAKCLKERDDQNPVD